jgi:hypothetical protein
VVKSLAILIDTPRTLLQVQEILKLASLEACGFVVSTKGLAELGPRHPVAVVKRAVKLAHQALAGP